MWFNAQRNTHPVDLRKSLQLESETRDQKMLQNKLPPSEWGLSGNTGLFPKGQVTTRVAR